MDYNYFKMLDNLCACVCVFLGYTQEEKVEIAHRHLIRNQLEQHGLTPQLLHIPQDSTQEIINRCVNTDTREKHRHKGKTKRYYSLYLRTCLQSLFV